MAKNVEDIYRRHIQALSPEERIELIALTTQGLKSNPNGDHGVRRINELHGLGKEIWQGVDTRALIDDLRREWNA